MPKYSHKHISIFRKDAPELDLNLHYHVDVGWYFSIVRYFFQYRNLVLVVSHHFRQESNIFN
jgi:hypothetical protein